MLILRWVKLELKFSEIPNEYIRMQWAGSVRLKSVKFVGDRFYVCYYAMLNTVRWGNFDNLLMASFLGLSRANFYSLIFS